MKSFNLNVSSVADFKEISDKSVDINFDGLVRFNVTKDGVTTFFFMEAGGLIMLINEQLKRQRDPKNPEERVNFLSDDEIMELSDNIYKL